MEQQTAIIYALVSTPKQKASLELQESVCREFCNAVGLEPIRVLKEVASGGSVSRPVFDRAVSLADMTGARIVSTKVDRISRRISVIGNLIDQGIRIRVVQLGAQDVNEMTLGIFASLAQAERTLIKARTREALRARKEAGVQLGNPNIEEVAKLGREKWSSKARGFNSNIVRELERLEEVGVRTNAEFAECLNRKGFKTSRGKSWTAPNIARIRRASASI